MDCVFSKWRDGYIELNSLRAKALISPFGFLLRKNSVLLGWEDPLEEEMATHSSILGWRIPWTEEPGRLQSIGS